MWGYNLEEQRWEAIKQPGSNKPSPRGGCQLAVSGDRLLLYGGHTVSIDKADGDESERVHDDLWSLDLITLQASFYSVVSAFQAFRMAKTRRHAQAQVRGS